MSRSVQSSTAESRAQYTGETPQAAQYGVARNGDFGIDICTDEQRIMRSQLAFHLFNAGHLSVLSPGSDVARLACYDITISPRNDSLVIVTDTPENVIECFFYPRLAFPGLRLEQSFEWEEGRPGPDRPLRRRYETLHLPTNARLIVTNHTKTRRVTGTPVHWRNSYTAIDVPLTEDERDRLELIPPMAIGIQRMLAALMARFTAAAPDGSWATGTWYSAPRGREGDGYIVSRRLTGAEKFWSLQWTHFPTVNDVIAMLGDPHFGLPGLRVTRQSTWADLHLDGARLRIQQIMSS